MELKETLSMPETNFPMRAGLGEKEPILVNKWKQDHLYEKMNQNRIDAPIFMLHDGPPYANGDIHCGHALNRCLKDFIIRYKNMAGFRTPFIFGWDTHGLPIEVMVTKSGVDRKATPVVEFREKCKEYALKQVARQKEEIRRLGCLGDYDHPYLTLLPEYEAKQIEVFAAMALKGFIYKGVKPVYWSPSSESALAEAEIEYHDVKARTMYVKFKVKDGKNKLSNTDYIVIWTTTPWTIPADQAVTVNPKFEYGLFKTDKGNLLFLVSLQEKLKEELGLGKISLLKTFKGGELEGIVLEHPLYKDRVSPIICAAFVTEDSGTGLVHTAPDHGVDDFNACAKYNIKPFCPVDEKGVLNLGKDDPLTGLFYEDANNKVVDMLAESGLLLKEEDIIHSYPHDWRTKKPVIFRATPQWFCSISPIREKLLEEVANINWIPSWGEGKMVNMIKDRGDWCISRQRLWGVPIPIIYNEDGSPIIEDEVFEHIISIIKEKGSSAWFALTAKELLPEGYKNKKSPNGNFKKESDIMDVWFDSGSSWNGTLIDRNLKYPADMYLEGNDQYRGWFNSSLILSTAFSNVAPFSTCLTHGFVMDEKWQKMSKSAGNGVDPNKIASTYGADILRLWAASVDYRADCRIGESIIKTVTDNYRKIRNTFKFMLGNLNNYVPNESNGLHLSTVDKFVLSELERVKNKAISSYESYDFASVLNPIINFMSSTLSSFYLDISKDVLYCDCCSSARKESIKFVLDKCLRTLTLLLNPILPFTMEEVHSYWTGSKKEYCQEEDMPKISHVYDESVQKGFIAFNALRDEVLKALEEERKDGHLGSSSDARIEITIKDDLLYSLFKSEPSECVASYFIVSDVKFEKGDKDSCKVFIDEDELCPRCRKHFHSLEDYNDVKVCSRCKKALEEHE